MTYQELMAKNAASRRRKEMERLQKEAELKKIKAEQETAVKAEKKKKTKKKVNMVVEDPVTEEQSPADEQPVRIFEEEPEEQGKDEESR